VRISVYAVVRASRFGAGTGFAVLVKDIAIGSRH
jgi:hypothetical protein